MRGQKKRDRQGKRVEGVPFMSDCGSGESVPREPGRGGGTTSDRFQRSNMMASLMF